MRWKKREQLPALVFDFERFRAMLLQQQELPMSNNLKRTSIASLTAAAFLAACGGGGSGTNSIGQSPAPVLQTSPIVASVPAPTYTGESLIAFNTLNAEREHCGFGKLAQNTKLDAASTGHVDWLLANNYYGHYQVKGTAGFTGVLPEDRIAAAGYSAGSNFEFTETNTFSYGATAGQGEFLTRKLLNAPFHEIVMLRGYLDTGVSFKQIANDAVGRFILNFDYGSSLAQGLQTPSTSAVRTYPCEGSTGIQRGMYGEEPSPVPGRDFTANPLGSSIAVVGDVGKTITITSASMTGPGGAMVALREAVTAFKDVNGILKTNEAFISADSPLTPSTSYSVSITGTNGGTAFSRNFAFVTGAN
jgi:uncharacterized protein YkwD